MRDEEDQLRQMFGEVRFDGEPPMASSVAADIHRGRRHLRRRRIAFWSSATAGIAALAAGVAVALPGAGPGEAPEFGIAADSAVPGDAAEPGLAGEPGMAAAPAPEDVLPFPATRELLLAVAVGHFDPDHAHLPDVTTNAGTGSGERGWRVSTKLEWSNPGEDGLGMVHVAVTTPDYAEGDDATWGPAGIIGCHDLEEFDDMCSYQVVPATGDAVLVAEPDPERNLVLGAMYRRPDGSFAAVGVYDLFGNNSLEPVSGVGISLEQAIAFVTDPALRVEDAEVAAAEHELDDERHIESLWDDVDFSRTDVVPAPAGDEMSAAELRAEFDRCIEGAETWGDFEPLFGMWVQGESDRHRSWMVASRGDTKLACNDSGAALFGTADVKGSPYLIGDVSPESGYNFGRYTTRVDRVTVQLSGGPQQEAVMRDGYWYLPGEDWAGPVAYRGYAADGTLVYSSTDDGLDACYTDPDGTEILRFGIEENPDIEDCLPMTEWDH